jgi:flagellar biosynthesis anti-sigma factor FlgM
MRIDPRISAADNPGTTRVGDSQSGAAKNTSAPISGGPNDTVQLSSGQVTAHHLVAQLANVPEIRQPMVDALRAEIQSGKFQRSNQQVAGAIVNELFGSASNG